jgi:NADPH-dependent glutamate synthase beta subunit-like oxidoreductase/CO/xanthine dehydrogenase FAD-binding subunit
MTLQTTQYIPADSLQAAEALAKEYAGKAKVIAGGTDLMGTMKDGVHAEPPEVLIGLKPAGELRYIAEEPDGLRIGALTTLAEIARHPTIRQSYALLAQAAASVASPQIRNVASIAGNLCQEPRCWYYRNPDNTFDCLRKGGLWCDAIFAENRFHSIYGGMRVDAAPCKAGCPIHNDISTYMASLRAGNVAEAVEILLRTNPLAAITGRVCSHYCEESCNRFDYDEPVAIRSVERFLGDYSLEHMDAFYPAPLAETGKSVAVVGAGPAGLTTAYHLRRQGHAVTVFDQMPEAGGMLTYSIPGYRLSKDLLRAQRQAFEHMGIRFQFGARIGSDGLTLEDLRARFDSVFLAAGLWTGRKLRIEKAELLDSGLEFLIGVQTGDIKPVGRRVLVIGGGSVAVDVALTARRLGAEQVTMACLETLETMPAVPEDAEQAQEEGIRILPSWGPQRVLDQDGKLTGLELVRCTAVFDKNGRFAPQFYPSQTTQVEADQVLVAIGQAADLAFVGAGQRSERNLIATDRATTAVTGLAGVFAGGDVTGDSATVVHAMASGKKAADSIHKYLCPAEPAQAPAPKGRIPLDVNPAALATSVRVQTELIPMDERTLRAEDGRTLAPAAVESEAMRCANCGCVAVNASDLAPALVALDARVVTTRRELPAGELFAAAESSSTVLAEGELIREIRIPTPPADSRQVYLKFRIRNAIDFPIVGVAMCAGLKDGRFQGTRLVLGAVAPVPLRLGAVEALLEGRAPSQALADEAARLATRAAQPLARNQAKVEIVKALVAKAVVDAME